VAGYATVQGGGICGVVPGERPGRSGGGLFLGVLVSLIGLRRRNCAGERR
jgi:MYXO-CTERM domain-containing protein